MMNCLAIRSKQISSLSFARNHISAHQEPLSIHKIEEIWSFVERELRFLIIDEKKFESSVTWILNEGKDLTLNLCRCGTAIHRFISKVDANETVNPTSKIAITTIPIVSTIVMLLKLKKKGSQSPDEIFLYISSRTQAADTTKDGFVWLFSQRFVVAQKYPH